MNACASDPIGFLKEVHRDQRRTIYEWNSPEEGYSYNFFEIHAAIPLGNHYHTKKDEVFHIMKGGGVVVMQAIDPKTGQPSGERTTQSLKARSVVHVRAFTAHTFVLEPGSEMSCYSSSHYDEKNNDMTGVKLVDGAEAERLLAETPKL